VFCRLADYVQLTLPPAFGTAYVGETFSCTLCANNELLDTQDARVVSSVRITAEMQTPSQTLPLELTPPDEDMSSSGLKPQQSLQQIVRFDLKEEGNHILTVSVNYSETSISVKDNSAASGRVRTFRKLYQFIAQPCLGVRTKTSELPPAEVQDPEQPSEKARLQRYALEAQLENLAEGSITLQRVSLEPKPPFKSTSINGDMVPDGLEKLDLPKLAPHDVWQVAFLLEQQKEDLDGSETVRKSLSKDGRAVLGQLTIQWRSNMGDPGMLSTGWLTTRRR
jgi:hypothetical protein